MTNCRTCGSEIVETVNDSVFGDGECNGCEYDRYKSQPALCEALDYVLDQTVDQDLAFGIELTEGEAEAREKALAAIEGCPHKTLPVEAGS
jgi:hypothetical protein